jgi:hypothetical protein
MAGTSGCLIKIKKDFSGKSSRHSPSLSYDAERGAFGCLSFQVEWLNFSFVFSLFVNQCFWRQQPAQVAYVFFNWK